MQNRIEPVEYFVSGLQIQSELPLPELSKADSVGDPDVKICFGTVPLEQPGARNIGPVYQLGSDDFLFRVADVARYRVRGGNEIIVDAEEGASGARTASPRRSAGAVTMRARACGGR